MGDKAYIKRGDLWKEIGEIKKRHLLVICCMLTFCCGCGTHQNVGIQDKSSVAEIPEHIAADNTSYSETFSSANNSSDFEAESSGE